MSRTLLSLAGFQVIITGRFWVIAEAAEGSVIDRMVRAAMPSVILAGKVAQKRKAANERQRLADQEALNRSLIENTARDVASGDGVSYAESDPQFL
jgi:hypothetical protein